MNPFLRCGPAWAVPLLLLLAAGCAPQRPDLRPQPIVGVDGAAYGAFVVPAPLLPFRAEGAARLTYRGEQEAGTMTLQGVAGPRYRMRLWVRLTGALALEVRFDRERLLVVDYVNETYVRQPNTGPVRERLFAVDLSPDEFQTLLTGRVTRARFESGGGQVDAAAGEARFRADGALHRFRLGPDGLPVAWVREQDGRRPFRVEYREYLQVAQPQGPPLRLPRKVRLYNGDGPALLVLGVRTFAPGDAAEALPPLERLPAGAAHFAPAGLPELAPAGR